MNRKEPLVRERRGYTLVFDPEAHTYILKKEGREQVLPSVTRVLSLLAKPKIQSWAMDLMTQHILDNYSPGMSLEDMVLLTQEARGLHLEESRRATGTGSEVHDWIEAFLQGLPRGMPVDPASHRAVQAFLDWWEAERRELLLSEEIVAHPELLYAGKVDLLLGDGTLVDFKTSKALYPEYDLQLGGYALALEAWEGISPRKGLLVRIGKDGTLQTKEVDLETAKETFQHLLAVYRFLEGR